MKLSPFAGKMCVTVDVQEHNIRNYTHVILRKMSFIFHNFFSARICYYGNSEYSLIH